MVADRRWWETRWFLVLLLVVTAMPLLWPQIPPLVDVPGHIGRYRVELDVSSSADLQRYFGFHWALIGNLGVDLLIIPLAPLFGLELAVKLIVISVPVLTAAGIVWIAREVHGRLPPTTLFAIPFVYSFPFNYGFINFSLSVALALLAFALWLRLANRPMLRLAIFAPLAVVVWVAHAFGWGVLGLLIWSSELIAQRDRGIRWFNAAINAAIRCIPLSLPIILMWIWRSGSVGGVTTAFFGIGSKVLAVVSALRDRWLLWDSISVAAVLVLIGSAIFDRHLAISRRLGIPALVLAATFILMPRLLFGSNYADMRLPALIIILALLALRPREDISTEVLCRIALFGTLFVGLRMIGNTISFVMADTEARAEVAALDHIPLGAAVLSLVGDRCGTNWTMPRHSHLGSYVITRKHGFSNDQWALEGAQLLTVHYTGAGKFGADPSEGTVSPECRTRALHRFGRDNPAIRSYVEDTHRTADQALEQFPRSAFDYVWLIRPEGFSAPAPPDMRLIWSGPNSWLFQVIHEPAPAARQTSSVPAIATSPSDT
jgi:hypothetical protein